MAEKKGIVDAIQKVLTDYVFGTEEARKRRAEHRKTTCPDHTTWAEDWPTKQRKREPRVPGIYE